MNLLKLLAAGAAVGVIVIAFRDSENARWITRSATGPGGSETEPFLGYDGMDVDALLDWFDASGPDLAILERMRRYEVAHLAREAVLHAIDERR